jgi:D-lactate dehydrogenase (cytochrome)
MQTVLEVNQEDLDCTVQAGVTRKQLNEYLRDTGLFFPVDPGADASIGGMASTRASGTTAVRYGTMRETVISLKVVLSDGRVIQTARRSRKSAAGYDLTRLLVGSEGTLGIITEVTLKLFGIPEAIASAVCSFPTIEDAVNSVIVSIQSGLPVARIELLDDITMGGINNFSNTDYPVAHTLFYEFHGSEAGVGEQSRQAQEIAVEFGGSNFQWETRPEDRIESVMPCLPQSISIFRTCLPLKITSAKLNSYFLGLTRLLPNSCLRTMELVKKSMRNRIVSVRKIVYSAHSNIIE